MTPSQFKEVRKSLGLSVNQLSKILDTNPVTIRKWETDPKYNTARNPNPIACKVLQWLKSGSLKL